jgi:tetratricopeptide (TPR) repeat protein
VRSTRRSSTAVGLEPVDQALRAELLVAAGDALHQAADPRGAELLRQAEALGREHDDVELLARISISLAFNWPQRQHGGIDEHALALAEHVLDHADRLPDDLHAQMLGVLSVELFWSSDVERRLELCERSLEIARELDDAKVLAFALGCRSVLADLTEAGALDALIANSTEMIEVATGIDDSLVANALADRSISFVCLGDIESGEADLRDAEELADRLRLPRLVGRCKMLRTARALLAGELDATEALLADFEAFGTREGVLGDNPAAVGGIRYRLQYERGQLAELEPFLVEIIEAQPQIPVWRMALCGVYLQTDRPELVPEHVNAVAADDFAIVQRNQAFLLTCSSTARIAAQVGAFEAAEAAYRHAAPCDDQLPFSAACWEYPVGIGVGAAAGALGWYDLAEQHFATAIDLCERAGARTYLAAGHLHLAEMLVGRNDSGDADRARGLAQTAMTAADELGLAYVAKRATKILNST